MRFLSSLPFIVINQIHLALVLKYVYVTVFFNRSLLKKRFQKICTNDNSKFYSCNTLKNTGFIFFFFKSREHEGTERDTPSHGFVICHSH